MRNMHAETPKRELRYKRQKGGPYAVNVEQDAAYIGTVQSPVFVSIKRNTSSDSHL